MNDQAQELIMELVKVIDEVWLTLLLQVIIAGILALILKNIIESLAYYLMYRFNKHVKEGTLISLNGKEGRIKEASIFSITIEFKEGYMTFPTKNWKSIKWIVLKDMSAIGKVKQYPEDILEKINRLDKIIKEQESESSSSPDSK